MQFYVVYLTLIGKTVDMKAILILTLLSSRLIFISSRGDRKISAVSDNVYEIMVKILSGEF